jgi:hypothetical protein
MATLAWPCGVLHREACPRQAWAWHRKCHIQLLGLRSWSVVLAEDRIELLAGGRVAGL